MYAVSSRNTMAGAVFKPAEEKPPVVSIIEIKRQRQLEAQRLRKQREAELIEELRRRKRMADEAVSRANHVLRVMNLEEGFDSYGNVFRRMCRVFDVSPAEMISPRRARHLIFARQAIMYWAYRRTTMSLPQIGKRLRRDHTTVLHGKDAYVEKRASMGRRLKSFASDRKHEGRGR